MRRAGRASRGVVGAVALVLALAACGGDDTSTAPGSGDQSTSAGATATDSAESGEEGPTGAGDTSDSGASCQYPARPEPARTVDPPPTQVPALLDQRAVLVTSAGEIGLELDSTRAPCAVNSFVSLARQGYFDDTPCHRLITQGLYALQCGDPTGTGKGEPGYSFGSELHGDEKYTRGTLAMAKIAPDLNGSQFFLIYDDSELGPQYTIFGHIDEAGLQVLQKVADGGTENGEIDGAPAEPVEIESVQLTRG